jgi:undecaprenyl-diphosphatase
MMRNFTRPEAARFAFLLAVPIMPAAAAVALFDLGSLPSAGGLLLPLGIGFIVSTIVGYLSIRWLLNYLSRHSSLPFALYCVAVGVAAIFISLAS